MTWRVFAAAACRNSIQRVVECVLLKVQCLQDSWANWIAVPAFGLLTEARRRVLYEDSTSLVQLEIASMPSDLTGVLGTWVQQVDHHRCLAKA